MHDSNTQSNNATTQMSAASSTTSAAETATVATEASKMLEAALQQMDGFITGATSAASGSVGCLGVTPQQSSVTTGVSGELPQLQQHQQKQSQNSTSMTLNERKLISSSNVLSTAKTLAIALQQVGVAAPAPDSMTAAVISDWLETHIPRQDTDERLRRLQRDKEALALQYQALADRMSQQADRIIELERLLTEKTQQLSTKDELLQRQVLSRSALETQKLELMTALSELKLHRAALERENVELAKGMINETTGNGPDVVVVQLENGNGGPLLLDRQRFPFGSMGNLNSTQQFGPPKTPPSSLRHQIHHQFHSLPRSVKNNSNNSSSSGSNNNKTYNNNNNCRAFDANANATTLKPRNVAFASNEKILIDDNGVTGMGGSKECGNMSNDAIMYGSFTSQGNSSPSPNLRERSAKGLRNIFGKLRRSNSGNLELPALEQADPEFKRGGVGRATAAGRIEWTTQSSQLSTSSKGYADWSPQEVCNWLCDLGLACYEDDCRKWLKANPNVSFFSASPVDIEKELNLKSMLHRKKIVLACDELTGREEDALALKAAQLDISWVMRWLDDIGLPQYKDTFLQGKVDGRVLHRLTMEDLANLHVSSCLHIASLRRGIQVMREMNWNPECLIRRSMTKTKTSIQMTNSNNENSAADDSILDDDKDADAHETTSECIGLWTAHRVMEWLRVADLSEYAPNLRGAGVHGALMLYEPRFNADLLADLLSIPPSKTLLRRHLATHFKELLGRNTIQTKRDAEAAIGYQPLTIAAKMKPPKKTQFSLKRRKSHKGPNDVEWTDYVCPMTTTTGGATVAQNSNTTVSASSSSTSTNDSLSVN